MAAASMAAMAPAPGPALAAAVTTGGAGGAVGFGAVEVTVLKPGPGRLVGATGVAPDGVVGKTGSGTHEVSVPLPVEVVDVSVELLNP